MEADAGNARNARNARRNKRAPEVFLIDKTEEGSPRAGTIEYTWNEPTNPAGVFSFVYYFRKERLKVPLFSQDHHYTQYINGLDLYLQIAKSEAFRGWKVVIYIDEKTLVDIEGHMPSPAKERIEKIFLDPAVILAIVRWPRYSPLVAESVAAEVGGGGAAGGAEGAGKEGAVEPTEEQFKGMVENAIMRCFRYHAFTYFKCPVFVRDADTYFSIEYLSSNSGLAHQGAMEKIGGEVGEWEHTLLLEHTKYSAAHDTPMLYGTQPDYSRRWHINARPDREEFPGSIGTYAGMINYLGGLPEWDEEKGGSLWQESIDYIKAVCSIDPTTGISTNKGYSTYIGKDEQIPLFIWLPKLFKKTFFFYFPFIGHMGSIMYYNSRGSHFKRAYNAVVENYRKKGINAFEQRKSTFGDKYTSVKDIKFFSSPSKKLEDYYEKVIKVSFGEKGLKEKHDAWYKEWAAMGMTDPEDPISEYAQKIPRAEYPNFLINPYSVIDAFRTPSYDSLLRVLYSTFQRLYRLRCETKGIRFNHVLQEEWRPENEVNMKAEAEAEEKRKAALAAFERSRNAFKWPAAPALVSSAPAAPAAGGEAFGPAAVRSFASQVAAAKPLPYDALRGLGLGISLYPNGLGPGGLGSGGLGPGGLGPGGPSVGGRVKRSTKPRKTKAKRRKSVKKTRSKSRR